MISKALLATTSWTLLTLLFSCTATAPEVDEETLRGDLAGYQLNGPVQSVRTMEFEVKEVDGQIQVVDTIGNREVTFDRQGKTQAVQFFHSQGEVSMRRTITYDDDGFKIKEQTHNLLWEEIETMIYEKGEDERVTGFQVLIDRPALNISGAPYYTGTYAYDENGELVEERHLNPEGQLVELRTIRYDDRGHKIDEETSFSEGRMYLRVVRESDEKGNFLSYSQYDSADRLVDQNRYIRNDQGQWTERISYRDSIWEKETATYNDRGAIVSITELDSAGTVQRQLTFEPEFDEYDNRVYELTRIDGQPSRVEERIITYYTDEAESGS